MWALVAALFARFNSLFEMQYDVKKTMERELGLYVSILYLRC